jgi:outer membrane protein assembly factor BamB
MEMLARLACGAVGVAIGVAALIGCMPQERYELMYPPTGDAARKLFDVAFVQQITPEDNFIMRPDEFEGVAVDHERELLYVGSRSGGLLALRERDGRIEWERDLGAAVSNVPALASSDVLLVGTDDGAMIAINPDSRESSWTHETDGTIRQPPVVGNGVVYFSNSRNVVYAVDIRTGAWRWEYEREIPKEFTIHGRAGLTFQSPEQGASTEVGVVYTGFDDGRVVAIDAGAGEALWVTNLAPAGGGNFADIDSTPLLDLRRGELVVASQTTGVHGLNLEDGTLVWSRQVRGVGSVTRGPGSLLLVSSSLEGVMALEPDGAVRWRQQVDPGVLSTPLVVGSTAFVTHSDGGLIGLDARTGEMLAQLETGSGMSSVPTHDPVSARLYAVSNRGLLVALDLVATL